MTASIIPCNRGWLWIVYKAGKEVDRGITQTFRYAYILAESVLSKGG